MKRSIKSRSNSGDLSMGQSGSRVFASAPNGDGGPKANLSAEAPGTETLLRVALRSATGKSVAAPPAAAQGMVEDLLTVSGGTPREAPAGELCASFVDPASAVRAARHLRLLVKGFAHSVGLPLYSTCLLLHACEASTQSGQALAAVLSAADQSDDSRIFLAGGAARCAREIPGLALESGPRNADSPNGENLLQLLPGPTEMKASAALVRPAASSGALAVSSIRKSMSSFSRGAALTADSAAEAPAKSRRLRLIGAAAVAGAIVLGTILLRTSPKPPVPAAFSQPTAPAARAPDSVLTSPQPAFVPEPKPAELPKSHPGQPASRTPETKPERKAASREAVRTQTAAESGKSEPKTSEREGVSFSSVEIDALIQRADSDSGNGRYEQAITEYNTVLRHDPRNVPARKGLDRALHNRDQQ